MIQYNRNRMQYDVTETATKAGVVQTKIATGSSYIIVNHPMSKILYSWFQWQVRGEFIQDAFSYLDTDEREYIMTGLLINWDNLGESGDV